MSNSPSVRVSIDHARHDPMIVTRFAGGDSYPTEIEEARALVAACAECAHLADDVRLLMSATAGLPAPRRTREFQLTAEQAADLDGSFLDRLLRPLAGRRTAPLRPLAGVAMSLGLALAVTGAVLPAALPAAAPAGALPDRQAPAASTAEPVPPAGDYSGRGEDLGSAPMEGAAGGEARTETTTDPIDDAYTRDVLSVVTDEAEAAPADGTRTLLVLAGLALAVLSLGALLLLTVARRRTYDRLLR